MFLQIILVLLPWKVRRQLLVRLYGFEIDRTAWIGKSIIRAKRVVLGRGAMIGNLTFVKGLDELILEEQGRLGSLNWVTAFPSNDRSFFGHVVGRDPSLRIRRHAAVTSRHLIDCTGGVEIGAFSTFGGWGSQIVSHSIDPALSRQDAAPITIGEYCFVGTRVVLLKGSALPNRSVLAAGSVLGRGHVEPLGLYSGIPAERRKDLPAEWAYFNREMGYVH